MLINCSQINAERSKFLVERLRITTLPTVCLAKEGKTVDYIVGFDDLGSNDEFPTVMLEWRLGRSDMINYQVREFKLFEYLVF